jgi:hypothetical protein
MLPVSRAYSVDDRVVNECGAVGGMRIGRRTEILEENPPLYNFVHQTVQHDLI